MTGSNTLRAVAAVAALTLVAGTAGCEDDDDVLVPDVDLFEADIVALNGSGVSGSAAFSVEEDGPMVATIDAFGLAEGETHPQHVHAGPACPTAADDADGDGLVEIGEGIPAYGLVLIPLDMDLTDPTSGTFPMGSPIDYEESVDLDVLLASIGGSDPDPNDNVTTLDGEPLDVANRTLVLHGGFVLDGQVVSGDTPGATYEATLPVACATFEAAD